MDPTLATGLLTGALIGGGIWEAAAHRRRLQRIPIRIHVNGTRGKSSVTRLIAAGLRAGGLRTCAKTTGTLPRFILPDGSEYPVHRLSRPNVIEQVRIVQAALECEAEALVIECMALQPYLQWLCEAKLVRATHGVITNARADHLDVMGPGEADVARALCGMVPYHGKLFTAEHRHLRTLQAAVADRRGNLIAVTPSDVDEVDDDVQDGFSYVEHKENVALALRVCEDLGVDQDVAIRGMWDAPLDPGVMTEHHLEFFGRRLTFVNGFAANDPESTERIWEMSLERHAHADRRVAIFNCRHDRPDRTVQLAQACVNWTPADRYILIGTGTFIFAKYAAAAGLSPLKITFAEGKRVEEIFETILDVSGTSAMVMGLGNIGGPGLELVRFFRNRSVDQLQSSLLETL